MCLRDSSHSLLSFTALIHCSHSLLSFTALIHCSHSLLSLSALIHCSHSLLSFTALIHCSHSLLSLSALIHCCHSLRSFTALIHCSHSLPASPCAVAIAQTTLQVIILIRVDSSSGCRVSIIYRIEGCNPRMERLTNGIMGFTPRLPHQMFRSSDLQGAPSLIPDETATVTDHLNRMCDRHCTLPGLQLCRKFALLSPGDALFKQHTHTYRNLFAAAATWRSSASRSGTCRTDLDRYSAFLPCMQSRDLFTRV
jgi:hypothetical protein